MLPIKLLELFLFAYITACVLYNLFFSVAGKLYRPRRKPSSRHERFAKIAILVPAYREDDIILSVVKHYEHLHYLKTHYQVVVIADSLQPATLEALSDTTTRVVEVHFDKSTKTRSLNAAFEQLGNDYDMALICDADNLLANDFLLKINQAFQEGEYAIQGRRVAKNIDTPFAILDTANEIIANHIYRRGANAVGLSASIIGSGMAFHYPLIKNALQEIQAVGGFDKVLQLRLIAEGHTIHYLEDALVFDEKVDNPAAFSNQRRRWLSSQLLYLRKYWRKGFHMLRQGNFDYFNLAVCHNAMLPRTLLLAGLLVATAASFALRACLLLPAWCWPAVFACNAVSLLLPIPAAFYRKYFVTALLYLPRALGIMVLLLFRLKGANKTFIHTRHSKTDINNPLLDAAGK